MHSFASGFCRPVLVLRPRGGILGLAGWGGQTVTRAEFLQNDDQLHGQPGHERGAIYMRPGVMSASYSRVANAAQLSGASTRRIRAVIANTRRALWWVNVPAQAAQIAVGGFGGTGLFRPSASGASEEMEVIDARTAQPAVEVATGNNGLPWNILGSYIADNHAQLSSDLFREAAEREGPTLAVLPSGLDGAAAQAMAQMQGLLASHAPDSDGAKMRLVLEAV